MICVKLISSFGLAWYGLVWLGIVWRCLVGLGFGIHVKLNYQVSLLSLGGCGISKLRLNPAWAELGNKHF